MFARLFSSALIFAALTACGADSNDPGPGGVSEADAKALDEAAEKLDAEAEATPLPDQR